MKLIEKSHIWKDKIKMGTANLIDIASAVFRIANINSLYKKYMFNHMKFTWAEQHNATFKIKLYRKGLCGSRIERKNNSPIVYPTYGMVMV